MDEKDLEKDIPQENIIEDEDDDDIEFDDNVNFEALTQQLQEHIDIADTEEGLSEGSERNSSELAIVDDNDFSVQGKDEDSPLDDFPKDVCKKYVVYITPENIDFVDNLSIDDRNRLINKVIYDQHIIDQKNIAIQERKRYVKHLVIVCLTVILGFPLMFFTVNKALQASISNYQQSQQNFEKLYKEKGKISNYQKLEAEQ